MTYSLDVVLCSLLRIGLGLTQNFPYFLTDKEWQDVFLKAKQQTVMGIACNALSRLPSEVRPPRLLAIRLFGFAETLHGVNRQINEDAAHYTQMFLKRGFQSVVLKGPANARLYPDPLSRQAGDIDIWVPGGYAVVKRLLSDIGLISESKNLSSMPLHISFRNKKGIEIEVHHRPADISFRNREFQELLLAEFDNSELVPEGFYSPSIRFALLMQLVHLYHHCVMDGAGLRHFMDYYILLTHSTKSDRDFVCTKINRFSLEHACAGIMWVLGEVFALPREQMLCAPDKWRGKRLYKIIMDGGNFGRGRKTVNAHRPQNARQKQSVFRRWLKNRMNALSWLRFDPLNTILGELQYWKATLSLIPERIRRRKIAL